MISAKLFDAPQCPELVYVAIIRPGPRPSVLVQHARTVLRIFCIR
jgi:hypothetical protein